jgi:hypothetical protein
MGNTILERDKYKKGNIRPTIIDYFIFYFTFFLFFVFLSLQMKEIERIINEEYSISPIIHSIISIYVNHACGLENPCQVYAFQKMVFWDLKEQELLSAEIFILNKKKLC